MICFFLKEVNSQNLWNFELGSLQNMDVPIWKSIAIEQRGRQDSQNLNNDTLCKLPVIGAQFIIGTEKHLDARISLNYDDDDDEYSQGFCQIKEVPRVLTKDDILKSYISGD